MTLRLDSIDVECILGERPGERTVPRPVRIDLSLDVGDAAAESDELSDAADYAVGLLIAALGRVTAADAYIRRGGWLASGDYPLTAKVN